MVFDATRAKSIDSRRVSRWFERPVRLWASLAAAAVVICGGAFAAGPPVAHDRSLGEDPPVAAAIHFLSADELFGGEPVDETGPLREGHATLWWSAAPSATAYRLINSADQSIYHGHLPHAFVSGLPDGEHRFIVEALGASGDVISRSAEPIVVQVQHWDPQTAWFLFALGAAVVSILLIVLLVGMSRARDTLSESTAAPGHAAAVHAARFPAENAQEGGE